MSDFILVVASVASASAVVLGWLWRQAARDRDQARIGSEMARKDADEARRLAVELRQAGTKAKAERAAAERKEREAMARLDKVRVEVSKAKDDPEQLAKLWRDAFK